MAAGSIPTTTSHDTLAALRWLKIAGEVVAVTGLLLWVVSWLEPLHPTWTALLAFVTGTADGATGAPALLTTTIAGGLMAGWGTMLVLLAKTTLGAADVGRALLWGTVVWFVVDSSGSVLVGAAPNVVGNVAFLVLLAVPAAKLARRP